MAQYNFLNNYNKFMKGIGSLGSPSAGTFKMMQPFMLKGQGRAMSNLAQKPTLGTGITSAATYALNANPYYAGLNMLTGGALDKGVGSVVSGAGRMLGLNRNKAPDSNLVNQQMNYAQSAIGASNSLADFVRRQRRQEEESQQEMDMYGQQARNMAMFGPSSRETAGLVAAGMAPAQASADAARAQLAANLSARGIGGGVAQGANVGLESGLAQAGAQVGTNVFNALADRAFGMRDKAMDLAANRADTAARLGYAGLSDLSDVPLRLEQMRLAEMDSKRQFDLERRKQNMAEMQAIGQGLADIGPDLFKLFKRGQQPATSANPNTPVDSREYYANPDEYYDVYRGPYADSDPFPLGDPEFKYQDPDPNFNIASNQSLEEDALNILGGYSFGGGENYTARNFTRPVDPNTASRLNLQFGNTRMGQTVYDPFVGQQFFKAFDGTWRKQ